MSTAGSSSTNANPASNSFNPARKLPEVSEAERDEIGRQSRPNAHLIHETIRAEGESELERRWTALLFSGFAAGLSMGLSLVVTGLLHEKLPDSEWQKLLTSFGYTVGFLIVVLGRQQLFTENTLTPILPLLHNRDASTLRGVFRLWVVVLLANIAATWVFAAVVVHTSVFDDASKAAFAAVSRHVVEADFATTVMKAVFAGWLIALMVWLLPSVSGAGQPIMIIVLTYVVSLGEFHHIVAGAVDGFLLIEMKQIGIWEFGMRFFVPTLLGNVIGGVSLVAILNYGQVASEVNSG
jgi:formate/nitrite transporter FocA (FNT family)